MSDETRSAGPSSPEPFTDEERAAMVRAVLTIFQLWRITDEQAAIILHVPEKMYARWKAGKVEHLSADGEARLSNLLAVFRALRVLFSDASRREAWIRAPNDVFGGRSALDVMLRGQLTDLIRLRRLLDAEVGGG